ncbi:MAG TPA: VOC family protein [Gaiellaceae bacterium]|nr:VOC family protein [Gaiellaceae bacterium]
MFDHVTIRVADREASRRFYDAVLEPLGHARTHSGARHDEWGEFGFTQGNGEVTRGLHVGFVTRSREEVDAFWRAGVEAGHASDGAPELRRVYHDDYYGGFLLDPDGNSVEAVFHGRLREPGGVIDHLWLRVADLEGSKRFWEAIAPALGLGVRRSDRAERVHVETGDRSFAVLPGVPTEHVHMAFAVPGDDAVREFHRAALAAGYRDNGPPGERLYHPGYYAAFALDPDGNNVEAVNHNRD